MPLQSPVTGAEWAFGEGSSPESGPGGDQPGTESPSGGGSSSGGPDHGIDFDETVRVGPGDDIPVRDGLLVEFEGGEHRLSGPTIVEGVERYGWRGLDGGVHFTTASGNWLKAFVARNGCEDILLENITWEQTGDHETGMSIRADAKDGLEIHNMEFAGHTPDWKANPQLGANEYSLSCAVTDPGGTGNISEFRSVEGADIVDYPGGTICLFASFASKGTLNIRDSHIENSGSHSMYASKARTVNVEGCVIKNCVNTNMRLSGVSTFKDSTIVVDADKDHFRESDTGDYQRVRGIWWENQKVGASGGLIENCDIVFTSDVRSPAVVQINGSVGGLTIRGLNIHNTNDEAANILVEPVGSGARGKTPDKEWVKIENCSRSGNGRPLVDNRRGDAVDVS